MSRLKPSKNLLNHDQAKNSDQAGFSLIEVMVVGGIMLTLGLGAATLIDQQSRQFKNLRSYSSRDNLRAAIDAEIRRPHALLNSMGGLVESSPGVLEVPPTPPRADALGFSNGNAMLFDCYWDNANLCTVTSTAPAAANRWQDFYLIPTTAPLITRDNAIGGPPGAFTLAADGYHFTQNAAQRPGPGTADTAGAGAQAVRFDMNGRRCAPTEAIQVCPIVVRTQFQAVCAGSAPSCAGASVTQIYLRYTMHNLLSGVTTVQGIVPVMLDRDGKSSTKREDLDRAASNNASDPPCQDGEVAVSATGTATAVCARARTQSLFPSATNCALPRVLRVRDSGAASELYCELPFPGNTASNPTAFAGSLPTAVSSANTPAAQGGAGACPSPMVATGIAQDGSLRCEYPLKQNDRDSFPMTSAVNYSNPGWCRAPYVAIAIAKDGSIHCGLPLPSNGGGNALGTNGQDTLIPGKCEAGKMVTKVGSDGSVECAASRLNCNTTVAGTSPILLPKDTHSLTATCSGAGEQLTGYSLGTVNIDTCGGFPAGTPGVSSNVQWNSLTSTSIVAFVRNTDLTCRITVTLYKTCCTIVAP